MGCMCIDCKHTDIVRDNHGELHNICVCQESDHFLHRVSVAWNECDAGEIETYEESEDEK